MSDIRCTDKVRLGTFTYPREHFFGKQCYLRIFFPSCPPDGVTSRNEM